MKLLNTLILIILALTITACTTQATVQETKLVSIPTNEFYELTKTDAILLDVRTIEEFHTQHIENAIQIDFYKNNFKDELNKLDKNKTYLIYCRSGRRTGETLKLMEELDFTSVYDLDYGINDWNAKQLPTITEILSNKVAGTQEQNTVLRDHDLLPQWSVLEESAKDSQIFTSYENITTTKNFFDNSVTWIPISDWIQINNSFEKQFKKENNKIISVTIQEHLLCSAKTQITFKTI